MRSPAVVNTRPSGAAAPAGEFPRPRRSLLAHSIADSVAEAIATGHLGFGERVVETALADKYEVSRVPVREALKVLATQGILVGGGHRAYRVATFSPEKIEQVFEVRLGLEAILLRDAVVHWRRRGAGPDALDRVIETMRTAARAGDLSAMLRADLEFHRTICEAAENEIAAALWNAIARHVLIIFNLARHRDVDLDRSVRQHLKLRAWIQRRIDAPNEGPADWSAVLEQHFQSRRPARPPAADGARAQRPCSARQARNAARVASSGG